MKLKNYISYMLLLGTCSLAALGCQKTASKEEVKEEKESEDRQDLKEELKEEGSQEAESLSKDWQSIDFISANQSISMKLPDKGWVLQADTDQQRIFNYPNLGSISILHFTGEKAKGILAMKTQEEVYDYLGRSGYDMGQVEILEYITGVEGEYNTCSYAFSFPNLADEAKEEEKKEESGLKEGLLKPKEENKEEEAREDRTYDRVLLWKSEVDVYEITAILDKPDLMTVKAVADAMNSFRILKDSEETLQAKAILEQQRMQEENAQRMEEERIRQEEEERKQAAYAAADASSTEILPVFPFEINSKKGVHIRTAPNNGSQILGDLPAGSLITVLGMNKNWYQFEYNGSIAYVSRKFF